MCSIGEDDFGDDGGVHAMVPEAETETTDTNTLPTPCNKCGTLTTAVYKLRYRAPECRDCFLAYARHKFRATLGSSKVLPRNAKVLLVFDGSAEALVLLDMLHYAQTQNTHKRLHCEASVLYIDERILATDVAEDETEQKQLSGLRELLARYAPFQSYIASLGNSSQIVELLNADDYLARDMTVEQQFVKHFASMRSLTSRQDFVQQTRSRLIAAAAKHLQCGFAFLSDISTTLAAQLLSAVALGRGGAAAYNMTLVDDRFGTDVQLVRPLRDLNAAEVELYLRAQQLQTPLRCSRYGSTTGATSSLQNLTQAFVDNLQQNFASTVSTVFRTGDKIAPNRELEQRIKAISLNENVSTQAVTCAFCKSPLDCDDSTTLLAIEYSRVVSDAAANLGNCADMSNKAQKNLHEGGDDERLTRLCHACRNMQAEMGAVEPFLD